MIKQVGLRDEVYSRLGTVGTFKESYSDVIDKLITFWKEKHEEE